MSTSAVRSASSLLTTTHTLRPRHDRRYMANHNTRSTTSETLATPPHTSLPPPANMGRNERKPVASGSGGPSKWTDEQRHVLTLCYKLFKLTHQDVNIILHRCFPSLQKEGRKYQYDHTRDEFKHRFREGRSKRWHVIDRPNKFNRTAYSGDEVGELIRCQKLIDEAAAGGSGQEAIPLNPWPSAAFPAILPNGGHPSARLSAEFHDAQKEIQPLAEKNAEVDTDSAVVPGTADREVQGKAPEDEQGATYFKDFSKDQNDAQELVRETRRSTRHAPAPVDDDEENTSEPPHKRHKASHTANQNTTSKNKPQKKNKIATSDKSSVITKSSIQDPRVNDKNHYKMLMVHLGNLNWQSHGGISHRWLMKNPDGTPDTIKVDSQLYARGGQVLFLRFDNYTTGSFIRYEQHAMVCNFDICDACNPHPNDVHYIENNDDLPYIHTGKGRDVERYDEERNVYIVKKNGARPYDTNHNATYDLGMIEVVNWRNVKGQLTPAYLCKPQTCESCQNFEPGLTTMNVCEDMQVLKAKIKKH